MKTMQPPTVTYFFKRYIVHIVSVLMYHLQLIWLVLTCKKNLVTAHVTYLK